MKMHDFICIITVMCLVIQIEECIIFPLSVLGLLSC